MKLTKTIYRNNEQMNQLGNITNYKYNYYFYEVENQIDLR